MQLSRLTNIFLFVDTIPIYRGPVAVHPSLRIFFWNSPKRSSDIVEDDVHFELNASFHATAEGHVFQLVPALLPGDNLPCRHTISSVVTNDMVKLTYLRACPGLYPLRFNYYFVLEK